jgi:hypothetical protein
VADVFLILHFIRFISSGSLFAGQPDVFPEWFNQSVLLGLLVGALLIILAIWLIKAKATSWRAGRIPLCS